MSRDPIIAKAPPPNRPKNQRRARGPAAGISGHEAFYKTPLARPGLSATAEHVKQKIEPASTPGVTSRRETLIRGRRL